MDQLNSLDDNGARKIRDGSPLLNGKGSPVNHADIKATGVVTSSSDQITSRTTVLASAVISDQKNEEKFDGGASGMLSQVSYRFHKFISFLYV